ncbi:MAG: NAD(P)-binding domain-containing protein, partial [Deltaproteobacteria bacterium]|nr:NAD(P)-binding domain-containing protein [Deltaproteobacteria bacterium]
MQVLIADKIASFVSGRLQDLGARVEVDPKLEGEALAERLAGLDPEVLIVRSTRVESSHFAKARSLALIIRAGAGVNTIDVEAASQRGIYVANCPGKNAAAVAELVFGHLINLDRRIVDNALALRKGEWNKQLFARAKGLRGRKLAVLGVGAVGREVIVRAKAFGMHVSAWSRSLSPKEANALGVEWAETPENAVRDADAVTVHLALAPETRQRIGASVFQAMKPGAYFINTSRGEIVDEEALLEACRTKGIRAGLDVFCNEPSAGQGQVQSPLFEEPNVYGTHHIGASTEEAEEAVGEEVVRIVRAYRDGLPIPNCVNLATKSAATPLVVVRYVDRVGVLAR